MTNSPQAIHMHNLFPRQLSMPSLPLSRTPTAPSKSLRLANKNGPRKRRTALLRRQSLDPASSVAHEIAYLDQGPVFDDSEDLRDHFEHVVVAFDVKEKGRLGCAYYIAREERLLCMEDIENSGHEEVDRLKLDLQPTVVLLSPGMDSTLESTTIFGRPTGHPGPESTRLPSPYETEIRPSSEFTYESALNKLARLDILAVNNTATNFLVPGDEDFQETEFDVDLLGLTNQRGKLLRLSAFLDMDSKVSIGCAGTVLSYLHRKRTSEFLPDDPEAVLAYRVLYLEMFTSKDTMFVNADTLAALQIIQPESHPSPFNQGPGASGAKESLSVFGLFYYHAKTPQGKVCLRQMFLRPTLNVKQINSRSDFVSVFSRAEYQHVTQTLSKSLSKIKNMRNCMVSLRKGIDCGSGNTRAFKSGIWSTLLEFCYHCIEIAEGLREVNEAEHLSMCMRVMEALNKFHFQRIGKMIFDIVDLELSSEQRRTVIKRDIDETLDKVKDVYDGVDSILSQTAVEIADSIPAEIEATLNVIYFPHLGFHITVPLDEQTREAIYTGGQNQWTQMFITENQVYFKNPRMHEMDHEVGDLYADICEIEIEIAHNLAQQVLLDEDFILTASGLCGELDAHLALTHGAVEHKLCRPKISEQNVIEIKNGRHILQEMTVPLYIPNDTSITGGDDNYEPNIDEITAQTASVMVLTGPNYSGKSVYQKQVAVIVLMAHVGSFVPADAATIGITDRIFTRITTRETVSKHQSAFMIDLQQIALALNSCTKNSLVIIDEFGKGTDTCDGAGLVAGVISYFLDLGQDCPKVLAATHFHEIFELGLFQNMSNLSLAYMDIRLDQSGRRSSPDHCSEVTYLYQLCTGRCSNSYGTQCAAMNGIPDQIIVRATDLTKYMVNGEDLVAICSAMTNREMNELVTAEAVARVFLEQDFHDDVSTVDSMMLLHEIVNTNIALSTPSKAAGSTST